jgi:ABC-type multidrug transport system ATPase subunit/ABC-type multidrug transport system permease subunit
LAAGGGFDHGRRRWDGGGGGAGAGAIAEEDEDGGSHGGANSAAAAAAAAMADWGDDDDGDGEGNDDDDEPPCCSSLAWLLKRDTFIDTPQVILDGLSGVIEPGRMVAIMGASGAGKTTLLNALSGRIPMRPADMRKRRAPPVPGAAPGGPSGGGGALASSFDAGAFSDDDDAAADPAAAEEDELRRKGISTGNVLLNGTRVTEQELGSLTGYVMQEDVLLGTLTPRETLRFAAKMQLPETISEDRKLKRVERILKQLDLLDCADIPVGTAFVRGISGGQRRRVSVGVEMIRDPSILFLDEPTSGLDSTTAVKVMRVLKTLALTGRTVIFTIHSPNSKIYDMFDTLVLLSRGKLAYFGPAARALDYFTGLGYSCPASANPAEFFLNVLQQNSPDMLRALVTAEQRGAASALTPADPRFKLLQLLKSKLRIRDHGFGAATAAAAAKALAGSASGSRVGGGGVGKGGGENQEEEEEEEHKGSSSSRDGGGGGRVASKQPRVPFTSLSTVQIHRIIAAREDRRLALVAEQYLTRPVPRDPRLTPFLTNYVPRARAKLYGGSGSGYGGDAVPPPPSGFRASASVAAGLDGGYGIDVDREAGGGGASDITPGAAQLPFKLQLKYLSHRTFLHVVRQPMNTILRVVVNVFLSIFVGMLFFQTGSTQQSVYARVGFLFFMTSIQAFMTVVAAVLTFTEERALFLREKQKHIYATSAYFLGRTLVDVVLQTVLAIVFGAFAYPMVGLQGNFGKFLGFTFALVMTGQATHSYALILGALVPYRTVALMLSPMVMVPFMMVTGFFAHNKTMPGWLKWLQYLSPQKFMFESMMGVEFNGLKLTCSDAEHITVPLDDGTMEHFCPFQGGADVLKLFALDGSQYAANIFITIALTLGIRLVAYAALRWSAWRHITTSTGS